MSLTTADLDRRLSPPGGWPEWAAEAPYLASAHPGVTGAADLNGGANCQSYAFAMLRLFGVAIPPHRSSELFVDPNLAHVSVSDATTLDLVLFSDYEEAWGAHVALCLNSSELVHLSADVGRPSIWTWTDFAVRMRYSTVVAVLRSKQVRA